MTAEYLTQARELEIKIAQGAKPGEGGQLPGFKVSEEIARIRHATRGVTLISPPPHHDIYSIEDLAQLIYDLKQINPLARVCVKLVSEDGIGTIAAGVVKAHADIILISGFSGGTGAAPLTSIKNAGLPWELGLAEAQQILIKNNLRDRVTLRVDGGLKTGADIVKAAILGAEEFGFGTLAMIAVGCVMVRQCHKNTCPVGVATQDPKLRAKYKGTPERVINLFHYLAADVRGILAKMGQRSLPDIIGRVDLLQQVDQVAQEKHTRVRLSRVLNPADKTYSQPRYHLKERNDWQNDRSFDEQLIEDFEEIITSGKGNKTLDYTVSNTHRSIGARLSHEIIKRHGASGLPQGNIMIRLTGTVGQSFGVFCVPSIHLDLEGEANDYVGKGLSGGTLTLKPHPLSRFKPEKNIICGNTCLYGATSGKLFVNGRAGERFAVRNSGAMAVVEGVDNHACEYMTGGYVLILGDVGENFGAGMTGGIACVYDPQNILVERYNPDHVALFPADWELPEARIFFSLLEEHSGRTQSPHATRIRNNWEAEKQKFVRVVPKELLALGLA